MSIGSIITLEMPLRVLMYDVFKIGEISWQNSFPDRIRGDQALKLPALQSSINLIAQIRAQTSFIRVIKKLAPVLD